MVHSLEQFMFSVVVVFDIAILVSRWTNVSFFLLFLVSQWRSVNLEAEQNAGCDE